MGILLRKHASLEVLESWRVPAGATAERISKAAHRVAFDYEPRPGYLYVRARMISSRTNDNHDTFPGEEIEKGYKSFLGKPVFINHHNANHRRARGVIVAVALHRDKNPDGSPDTWVEGLHEIDAVRFPRLCKAIIAKKVNRTSMGVDVEWSTCSACGNKATSPAEYCRHLPALKGKKIRKRNPATGKVEERLIHEICAGLSFFENSLLVEEPADPTAYLLGDVDTRGMSKAASRGRPARRTASVALLRHLRDAHGISDEDIERRATALYEGSGRRMPPASSPGAYSMAAGEAAAMLHHQEHGGSYQSRAGEVPHSHGFTDELTSRQLAPRRIIPGSPDSSAVLLPGEGRAGWDENVAGRTRQFSPEMPHMSGKAAPKAGARITVEQARNAAGWEYVPGYGDDPRFDGVSLKKDKDGFFVHTHRARSDSYPSPEKIPDGRIDFIRSTGSRRSASLSGPHPGRLQTGDRSACRQNCTYGGTTCLHCGEPVRVNLHKTEVNGGWHHHDGLKRDHEATPADPQGVMDSIPGQIAYKDRIRAQVGDQFHRQLEEYGGQPIPRRRGDEGQMPPDPFLAARREAAPKKEGGDHPFFHANPVHPANIVRAYHETTPDEKSLGDRWYADAHHVAKAISGGDAAKGAGVLSAYSPRTSWPVNMFNASRAFQGDPPGPGSGAMGMHQRPAMRILAGEHHSKVLKAPKTAAFAHLIEHGGDTPEDEKGKSHKVVIDRHAMSVAMGRRISDDDDAPLGQPQHYEHVAKAYRVAAEVLSRHYGRKISPHQVQAATWLGQIRKNQAEDTAGKGGGGAGAGKGRVQMQDNARTRWHTHHPEAHPGGIPEHNMHYHGHLADHLPHPSHCVGCQRQLDESEGFPSGRSPQAPFLCNGCALKAFQGQDYRVPETRRGYPVRRINEGDYLAPSLSVRRLDQRSAAAVIAAAAPEAYWPRTAYGETRVPPQVDTLRMEECPVCGEHDVWSGDRCPVCGFIVPPSLFRDPDTSKAQQVRDELSQSGEVITQPGAPGDPSTQQVGSGEDADDQLAHPDQVAPDGTPGVQEGGPVPGAATDGQPPEEGGLPPDGQEETAEGEQEEEEGEELQEQGAEESAEGQELEQQGEEDQLTAGAVPDLECPGCGAHYATDVGAQPGTPCPACGMGSLQPVGGPQKDQEDPDAEEEDEGEDEMPASKTAAALAQAQAMRIAQLTAENEALAAQLSFLARAAGVDRQLTQIRQAVLRRHADLLNPASPVPDPPQAPAPESTEQALAPAAMDDPSRPGTTPGANAHVPAAMTTTSITPGVEVQTAPATNLVDVTAPVQGTNPSQDGGVPVEQRRIETDVRIDPDPLKANGPGIGGVGNNGAAFPWLLDGQQPQQQGQQRQAAAQGARPGEADAAQRTFASIRLAKLRITAGLAQGDELAVAERIERDASLPTPVMEHEIRVLSAMPQQQGLQAQRPMQRAAARQAPSLASVGATAAYAPALAYEGDNGEDLFF